MVALVTFSSSKICKTKDYHLFQFDFLRHCVSKSAWDYLSERF